MLSMWYRPCNPNTSEAEAGRLSVWSCNYSTSGLCVQGQPEAHSKTVSKAISNMTDGFFLSLLCPHTCAPGLESCSWYPFLLTLSPSLSAPQHDFWCQRWLNDHPHVHSVFIEPSGSQRLHFLASRGPPLHRNRGDELLSILPALRGHSATNCIHAMQMRATPHPGWAGHCTKRALKLYHFFKNWRLLTVAHQQEQDPPATFKHCYLGVSVRVLECDCFTNISSPSPTHTYHYRVSCPFLPFIKMAIICNL